jgi:NAD(P)-dependent dehydrogenase (short-subunit alcohol dehydrogenase family)
MDFGLTGQVAIVTGATANIGRAITLDLAAEGAVLVAKVVPGMIERRRGRIVNIGSLSGIVGDYMLPIYSTAKAAVHGFTKVLAKEVGPFGVTVNCVAPYGTMSDDPEAYSTGSRFHPGDGGTLL